MAELETRSKEILSSLTEGLDFTIPNIDFNDKAFEIPQALIDALQKVPEPLTTALLTERVVGGNGTFDAIMTAMKEHLKIEYNEGRITGAEYTKAYIAMLQSALQFAVQYLLGRDNAYFQAIGAQTQALTNSINIYKAKVELAIAQAQAHQNKAEYANRVLGLGTVEKQTLLTNAQTSKTTEEVKLVTSQTARTDQDTKLTTANIARTEEETKLVSANTLKAGKEALHIEAQTALTEANKNKVTEEVKLVTSQTTKVTKEIPMVEAQTEQIKKNTDLAIANTAKVKEETRLVGTQILVQTQQEKLLKEQTEQIHAQTSDTKTDGSTEVTGLMGVQKDVNIKQGNLIVAQTDVQKQQKELLIEQTEQAHAQVSDTQLDGTTPVTGYTGNQNSLLKQQVTSFKKDAIIKAAKVYADSLTTQLSMNTATVAGTGLDAAGIGKAIGKLASSMDSQ